jgi:hypothetical protein
VYSCSTSKVVGSLASTLINTTSGRDVRIRTLKRGEP